PDHRVHHADSGERQRHRHDAGGLRVDVRAAGCPRPAGVRRIGAVSGARHCRNAAGRSALCADERTQEERGRVVTLILYGAIYALALTPGLPVGFALFGRRHAAAWIVGGALGYFLTSL